MGVTLIIKYETAFLDKCFGSSFLSGTTPTKIFIKLVPSNDELMLLYKYYPIRTKNKLARALTLFERTDGRPALLVPRVALRRGKILTVQSKLCSL